MTDKPFGTGTGCPECGVMVLTDKPYLCEHGVYVAQPITLSFTTTIEDPGLWRRLTGGAPT